MRIRGWSLGVCSSDLITRRSLVQILPPQPVLGSRPIARCNWPALIWAGNFGPEIFGPKTLPFGPKTLPGNPHTRRQAANDGQQTTDKRRRATSQPSSEEHTSELQSLMRNSYAIFCLNKQTNIHHHLNTHQLNK